MTLAGCCKTAKTHNSNDQNYISANMKKILLLALSNVVFLSLLTAQNIGSGKELKKGTKYGGLLISYSGSQKENVQSTFENIIKSDETQSSFKFGGGYFFGPRMAAGIGFNIGTNKVNKEVKNAFGPNTITDKKTNQFGFSPFIRNYLSLDKNRHFYLYTQTGLVFGRDKGTETATTGDRITKTDVQTNSYGISFTPGLLAFVEKGFAFEVNVGVGGINHSKETRKTAGEPDAIIKQTDVDLNINILKMNLGISYYF